MDRKRIETGSASLNAVVAREIVRVLPAIVDVFLRARDARAARLEHSVEDLQHELGQLQEELEALRRARIRDAA